MQIGMMIWQTVISWTPWDREGTDTEYGMEQSKGV